MTPRTILQSRIEALLHQGLDRATIAERLGVSKTTIHKYAKRTEK